jgi:hypothetical protein
VSRAVLLGFNLIERRQRRACHTLEQIAVRFRPGKDADAEQDAEQQVRQIARFLTPRHGTVFLNGGDGATEEGFDLAKTRRDFGAELAIMGRDFERRVDEQAATAGAVRQRPLDDLFEQGSNRILGREGTFQLLDARAHRAIDITIERLDDLRRFRPTTRCGFSIIIGRSTTANGRT